MMQTIRRLFGGNSVHQSGNSVVGDLVGGDVFVQNRRLGKSIESEGEQRHRVHAVDAFRELSMAGPFNTYFQVAEDTAVVVRAAENILDLVKIEVFRGRLSISLDGNVTLKRWIEVCVSGPTLEKLVIVGAGHFRSDRLTASSLCVKTVGKNETLLYGNVDRLKVVHEGSGTIDATRLVARDVIAKLTGSGQIDIEATDSVDATLTGSGDISIHGSATQVKQRIVGLGVIERKR